MNIQTNDEKNTIPVTEDDAFSSFRRDISRTILSSTSSATSIRVR